MLKDLMRSTYKNLKKHWQTNQLRRKKHCKKQNYCKQYLVNQLDECLISLKDLKPTFTNIPNTRLINPAKNKIDRLNKSILDKINNKLGNTTCLNQWRDTSKVINWFNKKEEASTYSFWHQGLLPINLQISPTKSPSVCQNKSVYNQKRRKGFFPFSEIFFL